MDLQTLAGLILRHALTTCAGFLIAHGYLQSNESDQFIAAGLLVAGIAWSWWQKSGQARVKAELAKLTARATAQSQQGAGIAAATKAATIILLVLAIGIALCPGSAQAQNRSASTKPPVVCDPLHLIPGCVPAPGRELSEFSPQEIADRIGKLALNDFVYADALAKATNNTVTEPCWSAWVKLLTQQQQPLIGPSLSEAVSWSGAGAVFATVAPHNLMVGQGVTFQSPPAGLLAGTTYYVIAESYTAETFEVSASVGGAAIVPSGPAAGGTSITSTGQVLQRPDPGLVTNVEYLSEAVQLLQSNSPIAVACAPMAQALQKDIGNLLGAIITGGAFGLFKLPLPVGPVP